MTKDSYNNQLHLSFRNDNWDINLAKLEGLAKMVCKNTYILTVFRSNVAFTLERYSP